jgi:hypothetical protein
MNNTGPLIYNVLIVRLRYRQVNCEPLKPLRLSSRRRKPEDGKSGGAAGKHGSAIREES